MIRGKHVFLDAFHRARNDLDVTKQLRVTFLGEPAGGPLREFLPFSPDVYFSEQ